MALRAPHPASTSPCRCRRYSDEELKALHQPFSETEQPSTTGAPAVVVAAPAVDPAALKRQLLALIPKGKTEVFAFQMNWAVLDAAPAEVKDKISGWALGGGCGLLS